MYLFLLRTALSVRIKKETRTECGYVICFFDNSKYGSNRIGRAGHLSTEQMFVVSMCLSVCVVCVCRDRHAPHTVVRCRSDA